MMGRLFVIAGLIVLSSGCSSSDRSPNAMTGPGAPTVVTAPADGETGVRLDTEIALTFGAPVDSRVIESDFHVFSERDMADSSCTHSMMPHGGMSEAMMDSARMRHMVEQHRTTGHLTWTGDASRCVFRPDQMLDPDTRYMIHLGPDAMNMMAGRMGGGEMHGHGSGEMSRHMMFHFVTMDTTSGHADHH